MIRFEGLKTSEKTQKILDKFNDKIDFVFQPVFNRDNEVLGYEALMRPCDMTIRELIQKTIEEKTLHELELATFFGATIAYRERKLDKKLAMNSFPSECFTVEEAKEYSESFKPIKDKLVIELLEYMVADKDVWDTKVKHTKDYPGIQISLDDFGSGFNGLGSVMFFQPATVKLDISLISGIDHDKVKQKNLDKLVKLFHSEGRTVLAEGIETKEEYDYLHAHGVDKFQGFYLGKPV